MAAQRLTSSPPAPALAAACCSAQLTESNGSLRQAEEQEDRFVRHYVRRAWVPTWLTLLGSNVFTCASDTREGMRPPRCSSSAGSAGGSVGGSAARTGPYPPYSRRLRALKRRRRESLPAETS